MDEIREVAKAYYHGRGEQEKELARQFFKSLDEDNNNVVCLQEYKKYVKSSLSSDDEVFGLLDKNGDETLDFNEVLALYYMDKVSIPRCKVCDKLLLASYFSCLRCLGKPSYNVCCDCYGGGRYEHHHASGEFADTRALLMMLDQIMEKADHVPKACEEDPNNCEAELLPLRLLVDFRWSNEIGAGGHDSERSEGF
ncbi:uncharacterized protein LOC130997058 [Salvia miltiorrhiza]|uniref:uncharacterized protein LOC130997058 n=1 Tax=Salvia miltiorrhiza TaxID=226208 RepID=UPI0025AC8339|nr:uncharacterized protein LOC130997058 [Salvia miltiorrhiza]